MTYKTILLHIDHKAEAERLLKAAIGLAVKNDAHLIGIYVAHSLEPYLARASEIALSAEITAALLKEEINRASAIQALFEKATKDQNVVAEWRFDRRLQSSVENVVLEQARSVDLLMIGSESKGSPTATVHSHVAPLLMSCSRPTIVVPDGDQCKSFGEFVFVAWDGSRESSRAVFDALPVLQRAKSVWVHRVKPNNEVEHHGINASRDLADALARHDVIIELTDSVGSHRQVGKELLDAAETRGADCIVMGAYGHNRMYDFLLGGATRYILANSTVPLIMSH